MRKLICGLTAAALLAILPIAADAGVFVSVSVGPPLLPVYAAPPIPGPGYVWVPGYWAWGGSDYYWVPGTWVLPPTVGVLWTPGYWGWSDGMYVWNAGYWGPHVGFYGGIDYGCGYDGNGYHGGYWQGSTFVINNTVINQVAVNRVAFNGGAGGVVARATAEELRAAHEHHIGMSPAQLRNEHMASADKSLHASVNHGAPPVAATRQPGVFHGAGIVAARNAAVIGAAAAAAVAAHRAEHKATAHASNGHPAVAREAVAHEQPHHAVTHEPTPRALAREEEHTPSQRTANAAHAHAATQVSHPVAHESHPVTHESRPVAHESHPVAHESRPVAHESHPVAHAQGTHPAHEAPVHLASASREAAHTTHGSNSEMSRGGAAHPQSRAGEQGHGGQNSERRADHSHSRTG